MKTFKQYLISEKLGASYSYSSTQVQIPGEYSPHVVFLGKKIPEHWLADHGREDDIHITVLYGLTQDVGFDDVASLCQGFGKITARFGEISLFTSNPEFDVVKIDIEDCPRLRTLEEKLRSLPNENKFPQYMPHCTIAYVRSGFGQRVVNMLNMDYKLCGTSVTFDTLTFSSYDGERKVVPLL